MLQFEVSFLDLPKKQVGKYGLVYFITAHYQHGDIRPKRGGCLPGDFPN